MTVGTEEITAVKVEGIQLAAFCNNGSATYEGGNIILRDRNGDVTFTIANPAQAVTSMWFDGNLLRLEVPVTRAETHSVRYHGVYAAEFERAQQLGSKRPCIRVDKARRAVFERGIVDILN